MARDTLFKLDENTKNMIAEISALTGIAQNIVKEIYEYFLIDWAIKLAENPDDFADLVIPYLGTIRVKYAGDRETETGELLTDVDTEIELTSAFKKLVGDIYDEGRTEIVPYLQKKIKQAVAVASTTD